MFYCRAYFNFYRSLPKTHIIKVFKEDNRVEDTFLVGAEELLDVLPDDRFKVEGKDFSLIFSPGTFLEEYFEVEVDSKFQVLNEEETMNFYPVSPLKLRIVS